MSSKSVSKATKKRKVSSPDSTQHRLDRFLSPASKQPSPAKEDLMQVEKPSTMKQPRLESNEISYTKHTLAPAITITNLNPSRPLTITQTAFNQFWEVQKTLVVSIFASTEDRRINYASMSRLSESLCRFGKSKDLYNVLVEEIKSHVKKLNEELLDPTRRDTLLPRLNDSWNTFCKHLSIIRNVFMELDRTYILPNTKFTSIIQLGKNVFSETILDDSEFRGIVVAEILKLIKMDRDDIEVNITLIREVLHMLIELSYYSTDFEPRFLTSTTNYYKEESNRLINTLPTKDYIEHAFKRRQQETEERITKYLDARTKQDLAFAVTNQLIFQKAETLITKGFNHMMDNDMIEPLKIFYGLLDQSPKLALPKNAFGVYIKTHGIALIKDPKNDPSMILSLLKFKKKVDNILKNCFNDDPLFSNALKESFESFINTRGNKPAELLAKFIDSKLKTTVKKTQRNTEVDMNMLDNALVLFRYIQSKDAFEIYYKRFLAKRLLLDKSSSNEAESHILEKLKIECGYEFTKNLETMFSDMQVSTDLQLSFKEFESNKERLPIHVKVIAQGTWPTYPSNNIRLLHDMASTQKLYEKFYAMKFNGRKLIWQNSLSSCAVAATFPKGTKEIAVSLSQSVILLLFNHVDTLSYSEIKSTTRLDDNDLSALLKSLAFGPYPLVTSSGKKDTISKSDTFSYNKDFEAPNVKLRIPPPTIDQTSEEQKVEKKVLVNRQHQLEAAIVRIMKAKKTLSHTDLMNEIFKEVNYPVEANDIKKRIESLIDRDYMVRDSENSTVYIYQS